MANSKGSAVVVGGEGTLDRLAGAVVVPDRGGQGQDALQDADQYAGWGTAAVPFEVELAFEGGVDRLDDLSQWLEQPRARAFGLAAAGRAQQLRTGLGQRGFEVAAVVVPVTDQGLARPVREQGRVGVEDTEQHLPFVGLGAGQREADRQTSQGGEQVPQMCPGMAQPPGLSGEPEQGLKHRERDQLGIRQPGSDAHQRPFRRPVGTLLQQVIGLHVQCGREGVQRSRHRRWRSDAGSCWGARTGSRTSRSPPIWESGRRRSVNGGAGSSSAGWRAWWTSRGRARRGRSPTGRSSRWWWPPWSVSPRAPRTGRGRRWRPRAD